MKRDEAIAILRLALKQSEGGLTAWCEVSKSRMPEIIAALSSPCACEGAKVLAEGWLYAIQYADGDLDDPNEIGQATFSRKRPGWTGEKPVIILAGESRQE